MGFCILSSSFWVHNHLFAAGLKLQLRAFPWMSLAFHGWHILMILIRNKYFRGYGNGSISKVLAMYIWGLIPGTYIKEIPSIRCTHVIPAPKTFVWGSTFKIFMFIFMKQGKHWHSQTQFNLLSFIIVMRTNGSRGMEKKPLEEVLRVLRGRDHRGERAWGQAADMTKPWHFLDTCLGSVR